MNLLEAELLGMHAGDGTLYRTNSNSVVWELRGGLDEQEYYHAVVTPLVHALFDVSLRPKRRSGGGNGSFGVQNCNRKITGFLSQYFPVGKKSRTVHIPAEILNGSVDLQYAFVRGLFDTDGCLHFSRHQYKRYYFYSKLEFSSASVRLRDELLTLLRSLGFSASAWNDDKRCQYRLAVTGKRNLRHWMTTIWSHNPKHLNKFFRASEL
ncbi:hypothetical protein HY492_00030 [Candidatus Woesearchaeota archaeon]|nr:hypothetical protein [Candidatus Woesearchaeota archaeon]